MKRYLIITLAVLAVCQACRKEAYWEKTLAGPFAGEVFRGEVRSSPASSLQLTPKLLLTVHTNDSLDGPILQLRAHGQASQWAWLMIARPQGQNEPRGRITEMTLKSITADSNGFKIFLVCNWTGGGREGGLVYLNKDYSFRSFALGW